MKGRILLLGGGALVRAISASLAALGTAEDPLEITIAASSKERALEIVDHAARTQNPHVTFDAFATDWDEPDALAELLDATQPTCVLIATSLQSARTLGGSDAWSAMVAACGYGVTLPFQISRFPAIASAIRRSGCDPVIVNACFPDVANAAGAHLGLAIATGAGNISLIADEALRRDPAITAVLASHVDLASLGAEAEPPFGPMLCWRGEGGAVALPHSALPPMPEGESLYQRNGRVTAEMLAALACRGTLRDIHLPGPGGLQGGYPASIVEGKTILNDLEGLPLAEAEAWHARRLPFDGATITPAGRVEFGPAASDRLAQVLPRYRDGFALDSLADVVPAFLGLRAKMLRVPA